MIRKRCATKRSLSTHRHTSLPAPALAQPLHSGLMLVSLGMCKLALRQFDYEQSIPLRPDFNTFRIPQQSECLPSEPSLNAFLNLSSLVPDRNHGFAVPPNLGAHAQNSLACLLEKTNHHFHPCTRYSACCHSYYRFQQDVVCFRGALGCVFGSPG